METQNFIPLFYIFLKKYFDSYDKVWKENSNSHTILIWMIYSIPIKSLTWVHLSFSYKNDEEREFRSGTWKMYSKDFGRKIMVSKDTVEST